MTRESDDYNWNVQRYNYKRLHRQAKDREEERSNREVDFRGGKPNAFDSSRE